jgi:hypothetical protein
MAAAAIPAACVGAVMIAAVVIAEAWAGTAATAAATMAWAWLGLAPTALTIIWTALSGLAAIWAATEAEMSCAEGVWALAIDKAEARSVRENMPRAFTATAIHSNRLPRRPA